MIQALPTLPSIGALCVDSHAHLDMLDDPVAALVRAARAGVALIATVVDLTEDPERTLDGLSGWQEAAALALDGESCDVPEVRLIVGWHPHNASGGDEGLLERLRSLVADPRVVAFGELGLDFPYDHSPRDVQRTWFRRHLALAHEVGLPVEVHLRAAHEEGASLIAEMGPPPAGCIIHCFTEGPDLAERFLELGCHISIAGPVTFKKADALREAARIIPLDRLLVETDCPFLAPDPYRGRRNEPAFVVLTAARIAEVKGISTAEVATAALGTARRLFSREHVR